VLEDRLETGREHLSDEKEEGDLCMSMKFSIVVPQGATKELAGIKYPVEAYEAIMRVAQTAEEAGFDAVWLVDALSGIASIPFRVLDNDGSARA
jgi:hypothetical protein